MRFGYNGRGIYKGMPQIDPRLSNCAGPEPKPTKKWHKIVVDIATVLVILGAFAWFFFSIIL